MINTVRKFAVIFVCLALCAALAYGQPGGRRRGGQPSDTPAMKDKLAARQPTGQQMSEQQKQNLQKLQNDLNAIKQGSTVTQEQKTALKNDLLAIADGATKPNPALVQQLANDLAEALADGKLSNAEKTKLAKDLDAVMDSASIPPAEVQQAIADAQAILTASGITKEEVQTVVKDLQAIAAEAQKNLQNGANKARARFKGLN
jgi:hypothetical protein